MHIPLVKRCGDPFQCCTISSKISLASSSPANSQVSDISLPNTSGRYSLGLGIPDKHAEPITSRPLALHGIARRTRHSNPTTVEVTSTHSKALAIADALTKVSGFLKRIKATAEQLS